MLWGVALPWSVPVGAQTGWTRSRTALAVIIMTSCVPTVPEQLASKILTAHQSNQVNRTAVCTSCIQIQTEY